MKKIKFILLTVRQKPSLSPSQMFLCACTCFTSLKKKVSLMYKFK